MKKRASIFNEVIGPVMRGPSSSHTAASWRIAKICTQLLNNPIKNALIEFDKNGAWAANYEEQGTAMGINAGLLGINIENDKMKSTVSIAKELSIPIQYKISEFPTTHSNTVRLTLEDTKNNKVQVVAISTGGGAIEIQKINDFSIKLKGDYFETIIISKHNHDFSEQLKSILPRHMHFSVSSIQDMELINIKSSKNFELEFLEQLKSIFNCNKIKIIEPLLPIVSGNESQLPFTTIGSMLHYAEKESKCLGEIGLLYEKFNSGLSEKELTEKMESILSIVHKSIELGLAGTEYPDRILPQQSHLIAKAGKANKIINNSLINKTIENVTAIMESKSAMEVIVAIPTAGSCGTVGGVLKAVADELNSTKDELVKAYFAAGLVGAYFAEGSGFSAEEYGCQVECGAASGMAAAGIAQLFGGSATQAIGAASLAIQNMIGLICDPVADRVEVPCLGKNINAAVNALTSAIMACSGFDCVIPLDEVIDTVQKVGNQMPACVKCTGKGGLSETEAALEIKRNLADGIS